MIAEPRATGPCPTAAIFGVDAGHSRNDSRTWET